MGPIGCIPYQKSINQLKANQCSALANQLAQQYNAQLKTLIAQLNQKLSGATFVLANVYDLVMEIITNYNKYGKYIYDQNMLCFCFSKNFIEIVN